jgi:hypothetical protein
MTVLKVNSIRFPLARWHFIRLEKRSTGKTRYSIAALCASMVNENLPFGLVGDL